MPCCALRYCKSRYGMTSGLEFSLFSFPPVDDLIREKWIRFVQNDRREDFWLPSSASKLCSKHFKKEDILRGKSGRTYLKKGSVPYNTDYEINAEAPKPTTPIDVDVSDSESIFDSPRRIAFKAQVHKLQKQKMRHQARIKQLGQQNRYLKRKIVSLQNYVKHLKTKFHIKKREYFVRKTNGQSPKL